jgi:hypothetical protein
MSYICDNILDKAQTAPIVRVYISMSCGEFCVAGCVRRIFIRIRCFAEQQELLNSKEGLNFTRKGKIWLI